jgi:hypothetical protein
MHGETVKFDFKGFNILTVITSLIIHVKLLPNKLVQQAAHIEKRPQAP